MTLIAVSIELNSKTPAKTPLRRAAPPNDTTKGTFGAICVIDAKRRAVAVPEIILCQKSVRMLFAAMPIDAFHGPIEDREVAFDGVGVDRPAPIPALAMAHKLMREVTIEKTILARRPVSFLLSRE